MAKKANPESVPESNELNDSPYLNDAVTGDAKRNWLSSRAAKITAIAVGSSLALGAAFAGGAAAGQIAGGAPGGEFGMKQSGPQFEGDSHSGQDHKPGPDGQRPPQGEKGSKGHRDNHDGPKSFVPPMQLPAPSSTTTP
jgi:hypothetical protein